MKDDQKILWISRGCTKLQWNGLDSFKSCWFWILQLTETFIQQSMTQDCWHSDFKSLKIQFLLKLKHGADTPDLWLLNNIFKKLSSTSSTSSSSEVECPFKMDQHVSCTICYLFQISFHYFNSSTEVCIWMNHPIPRAPKIPDIELIISLHLIWIEWHWMNIDCRY